MLCALRRRVRYYETDRMGVVHYSNYLRLVEEARLDFLAQHVASYSAMEKQGVIIPCSSARGDFRAFLRYDDPFSVQMALTRFTGARLCFAYRIFNDDTGQLCYEGTSEHFFARDGDYFPISLKAKAPELYRKFQALVQA
ncbi:MAG: acyl-CoA thioesterase [Oscillospiraceae bacterium]|nr:acyl-CoA thioesterase [Oscillospiraceae bacterium]